MRFFSRLSGHSMLLVAMSIAFFIGTAGTARAEVFASTPTRSIGPFTSGQAGSWTPADDRSVGAMLSGQNGWSSGATCDASLLDQEVMHSDAHAGRQAFRISNWYTSPCVDSVVSPTFAAVGESGSATVAGAPAVTNSVSYDFWFRSASTSPDPGLSFTTQLSALASYRLTFLKFVDATNTVTCPTNACLHLKSTGIASDDGTPDGGVDFVAHYSPALVRGDWYHVVVNATFNDGPLNDVIQTDVYDSIGALVWSDISNSWEFGYYSGFFNGHTNDPRPVQGPFAAGNVSFDISASTGPGPAGAYATAAPHGIIVDDLGIVPGTGVGYATGFESDRWVAAAGGSDNGDCSNQTTPCASIAYAIGQSTAYNTIHVGGGTYAVAAGSNLAIDASKDGLHLVAWDPLDKPVITRLAGGTNQPLLVIDGAEDVRVENIAFHMDQSFVAEGILASGFVDGLVIANNEFTTSQSNIGVDSSYGFRNAIAINYGNDSQGLGTAAGSTVTVTGNTISGAADPLNGTFLRSGIQMDSGNGLIAGNNVTAGVHDIIVRFATSTPASTGDTVTIDNNQTFGRGLEITAPNASTSQITVSNNAIHAPAGINATTAYPADWSLMRMISNDALVATTVSDNTFSGHQGTFRGLLIENYPGVQLLGNTFTPAANASDFVSLVLSNKEVTTDTPASPPLAFSITAQGNLFDGSGVSNAGTAVELLNDNDAGGTATFGTLAFGGSGAGQANQFGGDLRWYFHLDDYNCDTVTTPCAFLNYAGAINSNPGTNTEVRPFTGNVSATDNLFDGVTPASMSAAQQNALLARTFDSGGNNLLGTVNYGLAPTSLLVYVDDDYSAGSHAYGDPLSFTSDATGTLAAYWQIDAFASIPDGLMHADAGGTVYVAKGTYSAAASITGHVQLIGDGTTASDTVLTDTLNINASGLDAGNPVLVQNLRVTDGNGGQNDGVSIDGGSFIHLDNLALVGNPHAGIDFDGTPASPIDHVVISDTVIDANDIGIRTDSDASVADVTITGSTVSNSGKVGLLLFGSAAGNGTIANWIIDNSQFLSNRPVDTTGSPWGGGIWLFSYGPNAVVDGFSITNSTFSDNGSAVDRRQSGIYVIAEAGGQLRNVSICNNSFNETAVGGTQKYGIYVYDDYDYAGYEPIEVCANNVFNGMVNSISGENQFTSIGSNPVVNITGGSIAGTNHINTPVLRVRDSATFPTISLALADAGTIAGDEIRAPAGLYHENVVIGMNGIKLVGAGTTLPLPAPSASAAAGPTVAPVAVLDGTGLTGSGVEINGGADDVTLAGFEVRNYADTCVRGQGGSNGITVQNNLVHHCGDSGHDSGIYLNVGGSLVGANLNYNEIHDSYDRGIVIWNGSKQDVTIGNNWIHGPIGSTAIGLEDGTATGVQIVNNTIDNTLPGDPAGYGGDTGIAIVQLTSGSPSGRPNVLANNSITNPGRFGISLLIPNGTGLDTGDGAIVVEDNTITGGANLGGFSDDDRAGIQVIRRYFVGASQGQIDVTRGVVIRGNTVSNFAHPSPADPGIEGYGIVVEGMASVVSGNTLSGNDVGLQIQQGNQPASLPGNSVLPAYTEWFDRGNAPLSCASVGSNTISGNVIDFRTQPAGVSLVASVTNTTSGENFCSIQAAIDDADTVAGDVIQLGAGSYAENVVVNKSVTLQGPFAGVPGYDASRDGTGEAVLNQVGTGVPLTITASNVTIDGLAIDNVNGHRMMYVASGAGTGIKVLNNRLTNYTADWTAGTGIQVGITDGVEIAGNLFSEFHNGTGYAMGVRLDTADNSQVHDNHFWNVQSVNIQVSQSTGASVYDNVIDAAAAPGTGNAGVQVAQNDNVEVYGNSIGHVDSGLLVTPGNTTSVSLYCNAVHDSGRGLFVMGNPPFSGAQTMGPIFHNDIQASSPVVFFNWDAGQMVVGSNYYGGAAPTSATELIADPLAASPIGNAQCGDNTPVELVVVAGDGQATPVETAFGQPLQVRVQDALGGAVMGQSVAFVAPSSGASAVLASPNATTDFNGVVSTAASANSIAGSYQVNANSGSLQAVGFALTNTAVGSVTWVDLSFVYDGNVHAPTAHLTEEPSVSCVVAPATVGPNAGDYQVTATCDGAVYDAVSDATATITPAPAEVVLSNLVQQFDGSPKPVTVTTNPAGVTYSVTYDGNATAPSAVGSYAVVATITDANYSGSASGSLQIVDADAPDLAVSISGDREFQQYGDNLMYTITVDNIGNTDVTGASVSSMLPATLEHATPSWTCVALGTATCTASGSGDLADTVDIPAGGGVVYLYTAWVKDDQSLTTDVIETTVTVTAAGDVDTSNDSATDSTQAVILRNGFEMDGDGAEPGHQTAPLASLGKVDAQSTRMLDLSAAWSSDGRLIRLATLRGAGDDALRVEAMLVGKQLLVRVVGFADGARQLSGWTQVPVGTMQLGLGLAQGAEGQRWLLLIGAAHDIEVPLADASASLAFSAATDD